MTISGSPRAPSKRVAPRVVYDGPGLSGVTTTLCALGWGDFRDWLPDAPGTDHSVRTLDLDGVSLVVDKANASSLYRPYLDPRHPEGGAPTTEYGLSRRDSLERLDGVVFVADSQRARSKHNEARLDRLLADLRYVGRVPSQLPLVVQLNKRDLDGVRPPEHPGALLSVEELRAALPWPGPVRYVPSSAVRGWGVREALCAVLELLALGPRGVGGG
ncbi:MAG: hypothetical protein M5U28_31290 [Sandaracinaceae bacterium]|nr:hypothetical protein [Sandaracinaceae bacterium]